MYSLQGLTLLTCAVEIVMLLCHNLKSLVYFLGSQHADAIYTVQSSTCNYSQKVYNAAVATINSQW